MDKKVLILIVIQTYQYPSKVATPLGSGGVWLYQNRLSLQPTVIHCWNLHLIKNGKIEDIEINDNQAGDIENQNITDNLSDDKENKQDEAVFEDAE